jgi:hypothetical protein
MTIPRTRPHHTLRLAVTAGVLALISLSGLGPAAASEQGTLGIRPSNGSDFFRISLYPGAAMDATVIVSNSASTPVTLPIYPVDAQSNSGGAFVFASQQDIPAGAGSWMRLDTAEITVPANSEMEVSFRVSVPANTPPGDYAGGVIIQAPLVKGETSIVGEDTAVRIDVIQRLGARVYLNVAGTALQSLEIGDLTWEHTEDNLTFTIPLRNTGNTILSPTGTIDLSGWVGANTELDFEPPGSIFPGESLNLQVRLPQASPIQIGIAEVTVTSAAGTDRAQTVVTYAPWLLVGIGLLLFLFGVDGIRRSARFVRRARRAMAQGIPTASFDRRRGEDSVRSRQSDLARSHPRRGGGARERARRAQDRT